MSSGFDDNRIPNITGSGSLTALNTTVATNVEGYNTIIFNVTGTWVGSITPEGTVDDTNWQTVRATDKDVVVFDMISSNDRIIIQCGSYTQIRLKMTAYTSGTATVVWAAGIGIDALQVFNTTPSTLRMEPWGTAASGAADSGFPVKVGAIFNSTQPTFTDGQRTDAQANRNGAHHVQFRTKALRITGNVTNTVKSGAGVLHSVIIADNTTGGIINIYDNTAGSGTQTFQFTCGTPTGGLLSTSGQMGPFSTGPLGLEFATGLTVVTTGSTANDITIIYI